MNTKDPHYNVVRITNFGSDPVHASIGEDKEAKLIYPGDYEHVAWIDSEETLTTKIKLTGAHGGPQ